MIHPSAVLRAPGFRYNDPGQLTALDWAVVALYFLFHLGIGLYGHARAGKNIGEFFPRLGRVRSRSSPCWVLPAPLSPILPPLAKTVKR